MHSADRSSRKALSCCRETKITLSGEINTYPCELVSLNNGFGVLRYVIDRAYDVHGVELAPGDETIALYWEDRPYTVYIWHRRTAETPVYYFNIADRISLTPQKFIWRDLAVDILVDGRGVHVLDEHELPAHLDADLGRYIKEAQAHILDHYEDIIQKVQMLLPL